MANIITLARFPLLLLIVVLLYSPSPLAHALCVPLLLILILMDTWMASWRAAATRPRCWAACWTSWWTAASSWCCGSSMPTCGWCPSPFR